MTMSIKLIFYFEINSIDNTFKCLHISLNNVLKSMICIQNIGQIEQARGRFRLRLVIFGKG